MMKTIQGTAASRSTSNSTESNRLKKSTSSTFSSKIKSNQVQSVNSMIYAMKQNRDNNDSKSNKKLNSQSSYNSKSFKTLSDSTSQINVDPNKKTILKKPETQHQPSEKKGTAVPIKNLKQKATGQGINNSTIQHSYKVNSKNTQQKENEGEYGKKSKVQEKKLYHESRINNRQHSQQSFLNFSCVLQPKDELGLQQFQVGRKLGKGRFGDVYMAKDIRTGFVLAIKMINKKQVRQAGMESQLLQEIKIQMFANHPNILKMYGFFADHLKIYLLLELATNGCLFKQIRQRNYLQESLASFFFRQVSGAVRYLHSHCVIHRDIKPQNILNSFSVLKLCDFGWAAYSPIYKRQTFCGTLDYVPPEIVTGQSYDEMADVWCLGVLCYELCTGKAPFESKTNENETYNRILKVDIEFPIYLSAQVVDFIGKIVNRDPTKRMSLEQFEGHEWMRKYENEAGRMIPKEIWEAWTKLSKIE